MNNPDPWERRLMQMEERLVPIAKRTVDITAPGWVAKLRELPDPLDEAGVRAEAQALLDELIDEYQRVDADVRRAICDLVAAYRAFARAASLASVPTTDVSFRRHLVWFSIKDQGTDARDAILELEGMCRTARAAGVSTAPILRAVAKLSSEADKYRMGSTRKLLLRAAEREAERR
jgi:hypothetical protein